MDHRPRILVVDDEQEIREPIGAYLEDNGLDVELAGTSADAMAFVEKTTPHLAILDIMLGQDDGFALCRDIQKIKDVPVIFLSGKSEDTERIIGLELGADDYVVKPFNPRELLARVRAVLRRHKASSEASARPAPASMCFGPWTLDVSNQELLNTNGDQLALSTGEARLLKVFLDHPNKVLSRDKLLELTQGRQAALFDRSIDNYISRIRKKIEKDPSKPVFLKTYWGGGYALNSEE